MISIAYLAAKEKPDDGRTRETTMAMHGFTRHFGRRAALALGCGMIALAASAASAQDWPARNVTVIVPLGAGSASDIMARVVADQLSRQLKQTFVVENRPGAGGTTGAAMVARAAPDGYTILAYGALATANALHPKLSYDTQNDFVPVVPFGIQPLVIVASPSKYKTLGDLVKAGKAKAGSLNYTTAGVGSASHFGAERLLVSAGITAQHIPFKGAAEAVTDVVAGRSDFSVQLPVTTLPLIEGGQLVPLAVSAQQRAASLPKVPTTIEAGLSNDSVYPFYSAMFLPAKTPRPIVERLHQEVVKALKEPALQERFKKLGVEPMPMTIEQFAKFFRDDIAASIALVKAANIKQQ
jgi:tripartite-type tricarboxylate transporter receptor subunit TctC